MNKTSLLRRTAAFFAAALIAAALTACGDTPDDPASTVSTAPSTTQAVPTTTAAPKLGLNALTGQHDMETDNDRPIGFVVTDETANLTQLNLESADLYFEAETEAGIPRILAIYASVDRIPERIGPVCMTIAVYPDREVHITITDKGIGIPNVEQAMQPLFTTGNPEERSGLGFAVMQSFMDRVKVTSKPGKGTRVLLVKRLSRREPT